MKSMLRRRLEAALWSIPLAGSSVLAQDEPLHLNPFNDYLQGCVRDAAQAARAEAIAKAVSDVQVVIPSISVAGQAPRYPLAKSRR